METLITYCLHPFSEIIFKYIFQWKISKMSLDLVIDIRDHRDLLKMSLYIYKTHISSIS